MNVFLMNGLPDSKFRSTDLILGFLLLIRIIFRINIEDQKQV
jgi:hypothetical protein